MTDSEQQVFPLTVQVDQPLEPVNRLVLPPFDADGACPKCAHTEIRTNYHDGVATYEPCHQIYLAWYRTVLSSHSVFPEHMDRCCQRCHYKWCEAVVES